MKSLGIAFAIAITFSLLLFAIVHAFGVADKAAAPIASSSLALITFIHDKVDKALSGGSSRITPGIVPVRSFDIRWPFMLIYVTLIFIGILEVSNLLSMPTSLLLAAIGMSPDSLDGWMRLEAILAIPPITWGTFLLGRWMGIRSAKAAYWILPVAIVLGRAIDWGALYIMVPQARPAIFAPLAHGIPLASACVLLVLITSFGILGVWRGNRIRFGAYFNSLLKQVPVSTRDTLLAITFEEAKAAASRA